MTAPPIDPEALVVALTLAPATWSRNRFFDLYRDPAVRRARRRANLLRCVARDLAGKPGVPAGRVLEVRALDHGLTRVTYEVAALGLRRATTLDPLEIALLRYVLRRAPGAPDTRALGEMDGGEGDRARIEGALTRMPHT